MGSKTGSLVEAKRLELQSKIDNLFEELKESKIAKGYTEPEKNLVGKAIVEAMASISLQLQRIENRHVRDTGPAKPYCQEVREAKVRKVPQKFSRRGFVVKSFNELTGVLEIFIPEGYPILDLLEQEFSLLDGNKITTGELVIKLPEQIKDGKKVYYSVGLQINSGVPWSMLSSQMIFLDTATEPTKEEVRSFFETTRDEYLAKLKQDHDKVMEYMFRPYKRPELGSPGGIFPLMKTRQEAVRQYTPKFFMGVDTYDDKNLSYCLSRQFENGIVEVFCPIEFIEAMEEYASQQTAALQSKVEELKESSDRYHRFWQEICKKIEEERKWLKETIEENESLKQRCEKTLGLISNIPGGHIELWQMKEYIDKIKQSLTDK